MSSAWHAPIATVIVLLAPAGCLKTPAAGKHAPADMPMVLLTRAPGYPGENEWVVAGLIAAIWEDGRILRTTALDDIGLSYIEGRLLPEKVKRVRDLVRQQRIKDLANRPIELVMHAPSDHLCVNDNGQVFTCAESHPLKEDSVLRPITDFVLGADIQVTKRVQGDWWFPTDWRKACDE